MKKSYTYEYCYQILDLKSDCTWKELRQAYKKSIQTWHPDRYEEGSNKKITANEKIKMINIAYNQIFRYYKEKGKLPSIAPRRLERNETTRTADTNKREELTSRKRQEEPNKRAQNLKNKRKLPLVKSAITISTIIGIYYLFSDDIINLTTEPSYTNKTDSINSNFNKNNTQIQSNVIFKQKNEEINNNDDNDYFTNGSSISDVIYAQGTPTKTDGDIWYYNKAEIHFSDGKVTHWVRSKDTQLKVRLNYNHPK